MSCILLYNILCMFLGFDTSENLFFLYPCSNVFLKSVTNIKTLLKKGVKKMDIIIIAASAVVALIIGFISGSVYRKKIAEAKIGGAEQKAKAIIEDAEKKAESKKKETKKAVETTDENTTIEN